jgi:cystathionine beta-lyase family protein involved in aluminum resistance
MTNKQIDKQAQQSMLKALESYKKDKNSVKEFYPCSQELNKWLQEMAR